MKLSAASLPFGTFWRRLDVAAFLRWWGAGLAACLPASWRRWLVGSPRRLVIEALDGEILLCQEQNGERQETGRFPVAALDESDLRPIILAIPHDQLVLRLAADKVLTRQIPLPLAAEGNEHQVVGYEIDRFTPFKLAQVYYAVQTLERLPALRRLRVWVGVVQRGVVDTLLNRLEKNELFPAVVEVVGAPPGINLLPAERQPRGNFARRRLRWALAALALGLLLTASVLPLWQQRDLILRLMPRVDAAQKQAEGVVNLRQQLDKTVELSHFLLARRQQTPLMIELLNELTAVLPDTTWVEQIEFRGNEVQIRGQSSESSALVGLIEASKLFQNVAFRSPTTVDNRTGKDRFFLSAQIAREP